jgi:hypothetical protein
MDFYQETSLAAIDEDSGQGKDAPLDVHRERMAGAEWTRSSELIACMPLRS